MEEEQSAAAAAAAEAWMLDSLRLYNHFHDFELEGPTRVIEWTGEKSYKSKRRNEVLHLGLPQRLYANANQNLSAERDFKLEHGGFSDRPVYSLKHIPATSLLVSSGPPDSSVQVWRLEGDKTVSPELCLGKQSKGKNRVLASAGKFYEEHEKGVLLAETADVVKFLGTIPSAKGDERTAGWAKIATTFSTSAWLLHGVRIGDIQVTEIESRKVVFTAVSPSCDEVAMLAFLDKTTVLACSTTGQLFLADVRQPPHLLLGAATEVPIPLGLKGDRWSAGVGANPLEPAGNTGLVARLSSGGCAVLTDVRNMATPLKMATCRVPAHGLPPEAEFLCITPAPLLEGYLGVSGFNGTIHIYETQSWDCAGQDANPLFIHEGHIFSGRADAEAGSLVTVHTWHPCKPRTLLSAASDGSLHVWDWADPGRPG